MSTSEDLLLALRPGCATGFANSLRIPSVSHCVGTGKLLGEGLGKAICEECGIADRRTEQELTSLSCLLRAFIVLDDFAKDHDIDLGNCPEMSKWLEQIRQAGIQRLSRFCDSPQATWSRFEDVYHKAYLDFSCEAIFESVIRKCYLIFLPFSLDPICGTIQSRAMQEGMEAYLFALQAMDDFRDMEEDMLAPKNHNLFLVSVASHHAQDVIARRAALARSLLPYIADNLEQILTSLASETARTYFMHSIDWVWRQQKLLGASDAPVLFTGSLRDFEFSERRGLPSLLRCAAEELPEAADLRAETMHTLIRS